MEKLDFVCSIVIPDYGVDHGVTFRQVVLDGGLPFSRKTFEGASSIISVHWIMSDVEFKYFQRYFMPKIGYGAAPFLIDLPVTDFEHEEVEVKFVQGSISNDFAYVGARNVTAQLYVTPNTSKNADYQAFVDEFGWSPADPHPDFSLTWFDLEPTITQAIGEL